MLEPGNLLWAAFAVVLSLTFSLTSRRLSRNMMLLVILGALALVAARFTVLMPPLNPRLHGWEQDGMLGFVAFGAATAIAGFSALYTKRFPLIAQVLCTIAVWYVAVMVSIAVTIGVLVK